jgi:plastocyanin
MCGAPSQNCDAARQEVGIADSLIAAWQHAKLGGAGLIPKADHRGRCALLRARLFWYSLRGLFWVGLDTGHRFDAFSPIRAVDRTGGEEMRDECAAPKQNHERNYSLMRKFAALALPLLLVLAFGVAGCGSGASSSTPPGTVRLDAADFAQHSATINAGQAVTFVNPATGTIHILCVGKDMNCNSSISGGPANMSGGQKLEIDPGQTKSDTFPNKGTFTITCTVHPTMNLTVTVQ